MPVCQSCGAMNREGARFCLQCATPLPASRPSPDDRAWLAAHLLADPPVPSDPPALSPDHATPPEGIQALALLPAAPLARSDEEPIMDSPAANSSELFAGRYEIITTTGESVVALDRQPWRRCWSCDTTLNEPGELYCTQCGAALDGRRYHGQLAAGEPAGLALASKVSHPDALAVLPHVWDQVTQGDQTLTLTPESQRAPLNLPLSELDALYVGRALAHVQTALHTNGFALGPLEPADVELTPAHAVRLRDVSGLSRAAEDVDAADLQHLANLLEALTATPRTTRRLDENDQDVTLIGPPTLAEVLREVRTGRLTNPVAFGMRVDALIADRTEPAPLWMRLGAATDPGMVRDLNEDSLLAFDLRMLRRNAPRTWALLIVADGMGGHSAGEVASDLALRGAFDMVQSTYLAPTVDADPRDEEEQLREIVRRAVRQANEYVLREARSRGNDMGTTITMALVAGDRAVIGNIGDSRTYLLRDGKLRRISRDHSLVQRLVDLGQISADDVYTHPQRNAVLRSLGDKPELEVDVFVERLRPNDALLLMSDGMWEMVRDQRMAEIIAAHDDPQAACTALIAAANAAGGDDNITVILAKFVTYDG